VAKKSRAASVNRSKKGDFHPLLGSLIGPLLGLLFVGYLIWYFLQPGFFGGYRIANMTGLLLLDELLQSTWSGPEGSSGIGGTDRLGPLLLALFWVGLGYLIGRPLTEPLFGLVTRVESAALSILVGLGLIGTSVLLLSLTGLLNRFGLMVSIATLSLLVFLLRRTMAGLDSPQMAKTLPKTPIPEWDSQISRWSWRLLQVSTATLGLMYVLNAAMPPFEFDVVEYHLQGPKEFFQTGRIEYIPHNVYLNMPLGAEMHSLAAMVMVGGADGWWWGGLAGKLVTGLFSLLAALLTAGFVYRQFGVLSAWATAALILSSPGNIHVAGCGLIDSVLGAYLVGSVIALLCFLKLQIAPESVTNATKESDSSELSERSASLYGPAMSAALVTSLLSGTAAACKYTGLVYVWLPCTLFLFLIPFAAKRRMDPPSLGSLALVILLGFGITGAPWLIKNAASTGNPVFPLAFQIFGGPDEGWTTEQAARWRDAHRPAPSSDSEGMGPVQAIYGSRALASSLHKIVVGSPYHPPALMPLLLIGLAFQFFPHFRKRALRGDEEEIVHESGGWMSLYPTGLVAILTLWCLAVWWLFTHRIDRFWLPTLPLMAILGAAAIDRMSTHVRPVWLVLIVLLSSIYGNVVAISGVMCDQRWFVPYSVLRTDGGTSERVGRIPPTTEWINRHLNDSSLLLIGEARVFDFLPAVQYATCFNTPPGERRLRDHEPNLQKDWLSEQGVTHLLIHWREIDRYRSPGNYGFSPWPNHNDVREWIANGVVRPAPDWPFESEGVDLLEVVMEPVSEDAP
jgi:hypothetical protein